MNDIGVFIILYFWADCLLSIERILTLEGCGDGMKLACYGSFWDEIGLTKLLVLCGKFTWSEVCEGKLGGFEEGLSVIICWLLPLLKVILTCGLFELNLYIEPFLLS